ncbi:MAG: hypothetical protein AAFY17_04180 [Cyanobacteria bacterium J06642_11]
MIIRRFLGSLFLLCVGATVAQAQMADVPRFDANGDFLSARVQGNRGTYPHRQWLVIEPDASGLNCRNANGDVVVTLAYGAVIDSAFEDGEAITQVNGRPWLKVTTSLMDVRQTANDFAVSYTCYVRANQRYIAPINPDTQ